VNNRILVVEDNEAIADLLSTLLIRNNMESKCVNTAEAAQELLARDNKFDLLLTDIVIPGTLDGLGLAKWVNEYHPGVCIGLMSGYQTSVENDLDIPVLTKPFREKGLLEYLQNRLAKGKV